MPCEGDSLCPQLAVCLNVQERCRIAEHALALKLDECKRLQEQQSSFSELMTTLEAELRSANSSFFQNVFFKL